VLGLGLRQRRLARHFRHQLRPVAGRRGEGSRGRAPLPEFEPALSECLGRGFEDKPATRASTSSWRRWAATSAISTTTDFLTSTSAPGGPRPGLSRSLPDVQECCRPAGSPRLRVHREPAICRKGTRSPAGTGTATATPTLHRDGRRPPGDRYHNILYQNPGQKNHWLTVNLVGRENQSPGDRRIDQSGDRRNRTADRLPARFFGKQLRPRIPCSRRLVWRGPSKSNAWKSIGRPAGRLKSFTLWPLISRWKLPSSPRNHDDYTGCRSRFPTNFPLFCTIAANRLDPVLTIGSGPTAPLSRRPFAASFLFRRHRLLTREGLGMLRRHLLLCGLMGPALMVNWSPAFAEPASRNESSSKGQRLAPRQMLLMTTRPTKTTTLYPKARCQKGAPVSPPSRRPPLTSRCELSSRRTTANR